MLRRCKHFLTAKCCNQLQLTTCLNFRNSQMNNANKRRKLTNNSVNARSEPCVYGFDRVCIWIDRPELPIAKSALEQHCARVDVCLRSMPYNSRWKLLIDLHQPTVKCLRVLLQALGYDIAAHIVYVEIARDYLIGCIELALAMQISFLGSAVMLYQRNDVSTYEGTFYYGKRYGAPTIKEMVADGIELCQRPLESNPEYIERVEKIMLRIPRQPGHGFHGNLDSDSRPNWTLIPAQSGQPNSMT